LRLRKVPYNKLKADLQVRLAVWEALRHWDQLVLLLEPPVVH
jgi:hypothetical protein